MAQKDSNPSATVAAKARGQRLKAALKANLQRRKAQARGRKRVVAEAAVTGEKDKKES